MQTELPTTLIARLRVAAGDGGDLVLDTGGGAGNPPYGSQPFIAARQAVQRPSGLAAAIIGAPFMAGAGGDLQPVGPDRLLNLYQSEGDGCAAKLEGSWAFVIFDPERHRVLLATDRLGREPLYYRVEGRTVLAGTRLASLGELAGATRLSEQGLYNYLYFHMVPAPGTVLDGFCKLAPAQMLELSEVGHKITAYWTPRFVETSAQPRAARHAQLKKLLHQAVRRSAEGCEGRVGAFLSGGLDSSTVAGMLSELQGGSCDAYAIGFDAEGYDEMAYARITANHFGIRLHEYYVTPDDVVEALPKIAGAYDEPFGNSSALPAYFCARMAVADGIGTLLAGDGGDELFAGNERYARQKVFDPYQRIPRWLRAHLVEPLLAAAPAGLPLVSKARSFIRQASTPLPDRLQYYSFLEQSDPGDVFVAELLGKVDRARPLELLRAIYQTPDDASSLNRLLYLDWQITLADNDLRKVSQACGLAGVKVRYPMIEDALVEFSTEIPSEWKLPGKKLRDFYKRSLTGWLPDATIDKRKHGFGLPFGVWMKDHKPLQELAYENILKLRERAIFQPAFLDQAVSRHREGHASYYGELIWLLTTLELWLAANQPDYRYGRQGVADNNVVFGSLP